jgi:uncharacterized protein YdeI (YjbR/CyaY-like superfamily)
MSEKEDLLPILYCPDQSAFESWLDQHHETSPGIRLQISKKGSAAPSVTYEEALDIALCFGWIDSRKSTFDDASWLQRFTPRGKKSIWSQVNKEKAERLIANGRMRQAGLLAIEAAKLNGLWDSAYTPQSASTVPDDFAGALESSEKAKAFYEKLDKRNTYAILFRIGQAKKPETRAKRIRDFVDMLERGEKIYP